MKEYLGSEFMMLNQLLDRVFTNKLFDVDHKDT